MSNLWQATTISKLDDSLCSDIVQYNLICLNTYFNHRLYAFDENSNEVNHNAQMQQLTNGSMATYVNVRK